MNTWTDEMKKKLENNFHQTPFAGLFFPADLWKTRDGWYRISQMRGFAIAQFGFNVIDLGSRFYGMLSIGPETDGRLHRGRVSQIRCLPDIQLFIGHVDTRKIIR